MGEIADHYIDQMTSGIRPAGYANKQHTSKEETRMINPTKVVTGNVRFSYSHVWEPDSIDGGDPKYSVSILIPKNDIATLQKVQAAVQAAIEAGNAKLASPNGQVNVATLKLPLRDGDIERSDDPVHAGHYFFNASSKNRPGIVDAAVNPILNQSEFYSGCYGRASVNFYAFAAKGNKGIAAGLNNVQKLGEGEPLAGGSSPDEDFEPAAPTNAPGFDLLG